MSSIATKNPYGVRTEHDFGAQDIAAAPVAEVQIPLRVPFGFHSNWVAA